MASLKSPLLVIVSIVGVFLIGLELWSASRVGGDGSMQDVRLLRQSIEELKLSHSATKSDIQDFRRVVERDLNYLKVALAGSHLATESEAKDSTEESHSTASPVRKEINLPHLAAESQAKETTEESHSTALPEHGPESNQSTSCILPPSAKIVSVHKKLGACGWEPNQTESESINCSFSLTGNCRRKFNKRTGCTFVGFPGDEQYQPGDFILPSRVEGEIELTPEEENMLRKICMPCNLRPRFFMVNVPLFHNGKKVANMGWSREPLILLSGGSPDIAQHFYFVVGEVGPGDSYRLGLHKQDKVKVVVDIGANIGLFSISVCIRFPKARIIAFEPHPANFRFLKYNLKAAGCENRVEAYNKGISSDGRGMKIYWHDSIGTSAFKRSPHYVRMETITPDSLFQIVGEGNISIMKVDCEGCEYEVVPLLPMARVESLSCEVHHPNIYDLGPGMHTSGDFKKVVKQVERACKAGNK